MEMQQVRYFVALAETLNFTRAAERCNVTQPALTRAIQALEDELGGPLFHRERANTHLSELGRMMLPYLTQVLAGVTEAKAKAQSFGKLETASLSLGAMCTIAPTVLCDFIRSFRAHYPSVNLEVRDLASDGLCEELLRGDIDIAIYGYPEANDERFYYLPLYSERFVIVVARDHPLALKDVIHGQDLNGQAYVNRARCEIYDYGTRILGDRGIAVNLVFKSERDDWVLGMVRAGLGFGFFPEYSVANTDLVVRPLVEPEFVRDVHLLTVRGRPHSAALGAFVRHAKRHRWPSQEGVLPTTAAGMIARQ